MRPSAAVRGSDYTSNCHLLSSVLPSAKRLCLGRANYCQSPDPGIKLRPETGLTRLPVPLCCKASPAARGALQSPRSSHRTLASVGSSLYTGIVSLPVSLPRFNSPTLLLEENFKS